MDEGYEVDLQIFDFSKAFDKVPYQRLLSKLNYYGIQGKTLAWINFWLTERIQRVVVDGEASSFVKVTSGVPQGTVLDGGFRCFSDLEGNSTNKCIYAFSFLVGKRREPQSINAKLFLQATTKLVTFLNLSADIVSLPFFFPRTKLRISPDIRHLRMTDIESIIIHAKLNSYSQLKT